MPDGGQNAVIFRQRLDVLSQEGGEFVTSVFQDHGVAIWRYGKTVLEVVYGKCPSGILQVDLLGLERLAV